MRNFISFPFFLHRDVESAAALQQALSGDNILEKERRLSEMILQLQMVREQLLSQQQQQHQQEPNKVRHFFVNHP